MYTDYYKKYYLETERKLLIDNTKLAAKGRRIGQNTFMGIKNEMS